MEKLQRSQIDEVLYLVLRTIYHYERSIAEQYGLDFEQIYVLQYLRRTPQARLTDLAATMEMPKFAASRLISRLTAGMYISRVQDPSDRRSQRLRLLEKGEAVLQDIEAASHRRITANLSGFPEAEVAELVQMAEKMHLVLGVTRR